MNKHTHTACVVVVASMWYMYYTGQAGNRDVFPVRLNETYDYIIVGSGSSGSVLAGRLSEDSSNTVLLLEAGGSDEESPHIRVPVDAPALMKSEHDWMYYTEPQKHACLALKEQRSYWPRGKVLGGSSSLNFMTIVRGNRYDYDSWAEEGCDGWSYENVLPYFRKSEDALIEDFKNSGYRGRGGPLPVTQTGTTPMQNLYLKAGEELGYNITDCNGKDQIGFSWMQSNIKNGERWSNYRSFVKPHLDRRNLHVSPNSFTTKVIIKDQKAIGVEYIKNGRKFRTFSRKEVILSAGAINSPQLLMLSGVGPKAHLQGLGIKVHADLPVGENLQDHLYVPMTYTLNVTGPVTLDKLTSWSTRLQYGLLRTGYMSAPLGEGLAFLYKDFNIKSDAGRTADLQLHFQSAHIFTPKMKGLVKFNFKDEVYDKVFTVPEDVLSIIIYPLLLHPKSKGTIRMKSTDPFDYPEIDPHYLEHPDDAKMMIEGIRFVEKLVSTKTMRAIGIDVNFKSPFYHQCSQHEFRSDSFWECYVRHYTLTVFHPTSTCRMGATNDQTAVVDSKLRVKGISGLRVVDASVMRNIPAGNTNSPATMIGERAADLILRTSNSHTSSSS